MVVDRDAERNRKARGRSGNAYEPLDWPASEWRPGGRVASRRRPSATTDQPPSCTPFGALVLGDEVDARAASSRESSPRGWSSSPSSFPRASTTRLANTRHAGQPPNDLRPRGSPSVSRICSAILRRTMAVRLPYSLEVYFYIPGTSSVGLRVFSWWIGLRWLSRGSVVVEFHVAA